MFETETVGPFLVQKLKWGGHGPPATPPPPILGDYAPELRKTIYNRIRLRNVFSKHASRENEVNYKKQCKKCVSLRKKSIKLYFQNNLRDDRR